MRFLPLAACTILLAGCHSAYIETTLSNHTAQPISLVELDYPSASFGTQTLAPGAEFHYRFKVLGQGALKFIYTDGSHVEHDINGPALREGDEGVLVVTLNASGVDWAPRLSNRSAN